MIRAILIVWFIVGALLFARAWWVNRDIIRNYGFSALDTKMQLAIAVWPISIVLLIGWLLFFKK